MYLRCSLESKPAWNGKSRVLFQNKNNHMAEIRKKDDSFQRRPRELLQARAPEHDAFTGNPDQQNPERPNLFCCIKRYFRHLQRDCHAREVFAAEASAALRHEEPANDTSQFSSVRTFS